MLNKELAKIFFEIAKILAADQVDFKPSAYRKAAMVLEELKEDVPQTYRRGGLAAIEEIDFHFDIRRRCGELPALL